MTSVTRHKASRKVTISFLHTNVHSPTKVYCTELHFSRIKHEERRRRSWIRRQEISSAQNAKAPLFFVYCSILQNCTLFFRNIETCSPVCLQISRTISRLNPPSRRDGTTLGQKKLKILFETSGRCSFCVAQKKVSRDSSKSPLLLFVNWCKKLTPSIIAGCKLQQC